MPKTGAVDADEFLKAGGRLPKGSKAVYTAVVDQHLGRSPDGWPVA